MEADIAAARLVAPFEVSLRASDISVFRAWLLQNAAGAHQRVRLDRKDVTGIDGWTASRPSQIQRWPMPAGRAGRVERFRDGWNRDE